MASADGSRHFPLPRKTLDVLAYLILNRRRPLPRATVAFSLFPDDDEEVARNGLRRNLSYLLSSLPPAPASKPFVLADATSISWNRDAPATIDVDLFESALEEERDDAAIALYSGELLATLYADWTTAERERLRNAFHEALVRTMHRDRSLRRYADASTAARLLLSDEPWREDVVRLLMAIRYEAGDRADALREFERFALRLRSEINAEPMAETFAVREAVLAGARLPTSEPGASPAGSREAITGLSSVPAIGLPFVGRVTELDAALGSWHAAADGRSGILFVAGEAGIGKSRFVAELARAIEREGGLVVRGETSPVGESRPYEAFMDALRYAPRIVARGAAHNDGTQPDHAEQLLEEHARATLSDDRAARVRLFGAVLRSIAGLAHARPVAVVLEDLHWAGADTIDLLEFVALRLRQSPVLLVVTMRSDQLPAHRLRALVRQLQSRGTTSLLSLERLTAEDSSHALRTVLPSHDDGEVASAVAWADGVPLLLTELLRDLSAGRSTPSGDIGALAGARFARLTPAAETALAYAAVVGSRFGVEMLAQATGWSDAALIEALGECIELGLVRASSAAPGLTFAFTHHTLHDATLARIPARERSLAHGMVARVLASLPESSGRGAVELARHLTASGQPDRAAESLRDAGRYALSVFANDDAREAATSGLALAAGDALVLRFDLFAIREQALRRSGALEERRADARAMLAHSGDDADRACEALERIFEAHADDVDARTEALDGLSRLASRSDRHAAIFDRVTATHAYLAGDFAKAGTAALSAAERFVRIEDERSALSARLLHIRALINLDPVEAAGAIAQLRPIVERSDDVSLAADFYMAASSLDSGARRAESLADARRSLELSLSAGDRFAEARAREAIAVQHHNLRDYEESADEHLRAVAAYRDIGYELGINYALLNSVAFCLTYGDNGEARRLLDELQPRSPRGASTTPWATLLRGIVEMRDDQLERAEAALLVAHSDFARLGMPVWCARCDPHLAEVRALLGRPEEAQTVLEHALELLSDIDEPDVRAEIYAISARLNAGMGAADSARANASSAREIIERSRIQDYSRVAWHLAATYALLDDAQTAMHFATDAVRAFVDDAMRMRAADTETFAQHPWHRNAIDYLAGRGVPLRLDERAGDG